MATENESDEILRQSVQRKIHPIIMYPFTNPGKNMGDITYLYKHLIGPLSEESNIYSRPITVVNQQTNYRNKKWEDNDEKKKIFSSFMKDVVDKCSTIVNAWCVDTCQMWLSGFGAAYDKKNNSNFDVYWIIPGDFYYSKFPDVLKELKRIPEILIEKHLGLCIGQIQEDVNSSKQLIDTYGTYGLLYNWFPFKAQKIREKINKPRSEFFAINHPTLEFILQNRWYAYEQMIIILLRTILNKTDKVDVHNLGRISDLAQGRDTLSAAISQVERTERVLKLHWREEQEEDGKKAEVWKEDFRKLDMQSGQIRGAALTILDNILNADKVV